MNQNLSNSDQNQNNPQNPENQPNSAFPNYPVPGSYPQQGNVNPNEASHGAYAPQGGYYPPPYPNQGQPQQPKGGKNQPNQGKKQSKKSTKPKKQGNAKWVWLGILIMLILIVAGAVIGYNSAVRARTNSQKEQSVRAAAQQYQLALTDIEGQKFENAKTRLEYVLSVDPNYPGATEKYTQVMVSLYPKETPTPFYTQTPEPTSTPDTRGEAEMLNTIRANMQSQEWESAIANMDALRNKNISYESMEVDGMYYIALRNYGIQLINNGYLESGIYRITLSEAFGPIDVLASNQRVAARNYLAGAGFWEIDWEKALQYYSNSYLTAPGMYDRASGYTAQERYIEASFQYAESLSAKEDYCTAIEYYNQGFAMSLNELYAPAATKAYNECYPATATPEYLIPTEFDFDTTPTVPGMSEPTTDPNILPEVPTLEIPDEPIIDPGTSDDQVAG